MAQLNFNANTVAPDTGTGDPVPAGWYNVMMDESEMKPTKGGDGAYLATRFNIIDGQYAGRKLFARLNLRNNNAVSQEIAFKQLSAICHAVGVIQVGESQELHGKPLKVKVKLRPADGEYEASNDISAYKNINDNSVGAAGGAAAPAMGMPAQMPVMGQPAQQPWQQPGQAQPVQPMMQPPVQGGMMQPPMQQPQQFSQQPVQQPAQAPQQFPQQQPQQGMQIQPQQGAVQQPWQQPGAQQPWGQAPQQDPNAQFQQPMQQVMQQVPMQQQPVQQQPAQQNVAVQQYAGAVPPWQQPQQ